MPVQRITAGKWMKETAVRRLTVIPITFIPPAGSDIRLLSEANCRGNKDTQHRFITLQHFFVFFSETPTLQKSYRRSPSWSPRRRGCRRSCTGARSRRADTGTGRSPGRTIERKNRRGSSRTAGRCQRPGGGNETPGNTHTHAEPERARLGERIRTHIKP